MTRLLSWRESFRGAEVAPSIYAADFWNLGAQLITLLDAGARIFHFDVGDGHFIDDITIGPVVLRAIAARIHERGGAIGCHLMVREPERQFAQLKKAGADSVSFHVEATADPTAAIAHARALGLSVGVAFSPGTTVEYAASVAACADFALCMSIHPGLSGQSLLADACTRIRRLRELLPLSIIEVDGGINAANIAEVRRAGADLLVAGSAIFWAEDPATAYRRLRARLEEPHEARL
ncbi:MAG: ribulose-phosphate 3-epimerase [bacterium]|nr:ribulose-phosphate 3-epimerase [bacterium]